MQKLITWNWLVTICFWGYKLRPFIFGLSLPPISKIKYDFVSPQPHQCQANSVSNSNISSRLATNFKSWWNQCTLKEICWKNSWELQETGNSVARSFLSEIADFSPIYRQIRQLFGPKSRKIRQFLVIYCGKIDPLSPKFRVLLHFYASIFSEFKILINFLNSFIFFFYKSNRKLF